MNKNEYDVLFQPLRIGNLLVKNRLAMAPMGTNFSDGSGQASEQCIAYYQRRAEGGVGLIITEAMFVHPSGMHRRGAMGLTHDELIPSLRKLTNGVHSAGGRIAAQLSHAGRVVPGACRPEGFSAYGPSALPHRVTGEYSKEMSQEEINEVVAAYGTAARRAKEAGFDAVEIHGTHGYLIMQFISQLWNKRQDSYGGSLDNRIRFALEVVKAVRDNVGEDYPIVFRMAGDELLPGGQSLEESCYLAKQLEKVGVSALHVSGGNNETPEDMKNSIGTMYRTPGYFIPFSHTIRQQVEIPVIAVGRLGDPDLAANVLEEGKADMICLGRPLIADPDWPNKVQSGQSNDIVKCIACNMGCIDQLARQNSITCVQNQEVGHESQSIEESGERKKILVAGAGLAGLEYAIRAMQRGHEVEVVEQSTAAGGQAVLAARAPEKEIFEELVHSRLAKLNKLQIPITYNTSVTVAMAKNYDLVILATGGVANIPNFSWLGEPGVCGAFELLEKGVEQVSSGKAVVVGAGAIGLETAHVLADSGYEVHVVELTDVIGRNMVATIRAAVLEELDTLKTKFHTQTEVQQFKDNTVILKRGKEQIELNGVTKLVIAIGVKPDLRLEEELQKAGVSYSKTGGCAEKGNALDTVVDAYIQGRTV